MSATISFDVSESDNLILRRIASRAVKVDLKTGGDGDFIHHMMNITACHANGNPLRLEDLEAADDFDFAHDMFGIDRHICRETGKLLNHFRPRFSQRGGAA